MSDSISSLKRRDFIKRTLTFSAATALTSGSLSVRSAPDGHVSPIVIFSKVYQSLNLSFRDAAALTAEAGLDGVDAVIRPQGEIEPEQAAERLPQYVEALRERQLRMPLTTTAISSPESPFAETILRTAKKLGIQSYRVGFVQSSEGAAKAKQLTETRAKLKALAALNKEVGIGALVQNHSPSGHEYLGGNLKDLYQLVEGFDPEQIGVAFDIGHALLVHGSEWESHFNRIKSSVRAVYVKDAKPPNRWVPFGQGEV